jgi:hypothetical protein
MNDNSTLGMLSVGAGELLTLLLDDDTTPGRPRRVTVITLAAFNVSQEMADYCTRMDRNGQGVITPNAAAGFLTHLAERSMIKVPRELTIPFGNMKRPSSRLLNEYRYTINPEEFWEEKILARYAKSSFDVFNHQGHMLMVVGNVDAPFRMIATIIDGKGAVLGMLRLDILSDSKLTCLNDDDIERLRLGLQADLTMNVPDLMLMVDKVLVTSNPLFGVNRFRRYHDLPALPEKQEEAPLPI